MKQYFNSPAFWIGFVIAVLLLPSAHGQTFRVDPGNVTVTAGNTPIGGYPTLYAVPGAQISLCTDAACTVPATTFTDATGGHACPINAPVVLPGTVLCTGYTGQQGQFGFWVSPGTYYYTVTLPNGTRIPGAFPVTGNTAGVTSVTGGTGISASPTTGSVTVTNTGVISFNGRAGAVTPATNDYTYSQIGGTRQGTSFVPQMASTNSGSIGAPLCNDGSGNATTTGCNPGFTPPTGTQTQFLQVQPNTGNNTTLQFVSPISAVASNYAFPSQIPGGALAPGLNTIYLSPVPLGVNGTNSGYPVYISGGTGTAESCTVSGGTAVSGGTSGTLIITCANSHSGAWTVQSATGGICEAAYSSSGPSVSIPEGAYTFYGGCPVPTSGTIFKCSGANNSCVITAASGNSFHWLFYVNGVSGVVFDGLALNSNFINTNATYQWAIGANNASNLTIRNGSVYNTGYAGAPSYSATPYEQSGGIVLTGCENASIYEMLFYSNWVQDITATSSNGGRVYRTFHGSPNISDSGSNVNYWDTHAAGLSSISWNLSDQVSITDNQIWGANRFYTPAFALGNPILAIKDTHMVIDRNQITGMTNLPGTCSVTNGSASITCSLGVFSSSNPNDQNDGIECETNVGTIYTLTSIGSPTTATLGTFYGGTTLATARCRMQIANDLIQTDGITDSSVSGNIIRRSGDEGIDINMFWDGVPADNVPALRNKVDSNVVSESITCGITLALGQVQNNSFTGNHLYNNHLGTSPSPGGRGEFCLLGTPDDVHFYVVSLNTFTGNNMYDATGTAYGFDVDTSSFAGGYIGLNTFNGNQWLGSLPFSNVAVAQYNPLSTPIPGGVASGAAISSWPINTNATGGAQTYTAAQMIDAMLLRDPGTGGATDVTPTAAALVAGISQPQIGTAFWFYLRNVSAGANTITLTGGSGVTISGTATVTQNNQRAFMCQYTNPAAPTVTCYSMGSQVY